MNKEFQESFTKCPSAIAISIDTNEEFKVLTDSELDDIEGIFLDRSISISFQSNVDGNFCIQWRLEGKQKMLTLEVTESHDEDLKEVKKFIQTFLIKSLKHRESGESRIEKFL
jgi:EAL domain-containing protein (putative c-di-GMP-specific phosphodiesterase class I)